MRPILVSAMAVTLVLALAAPSLGAQPKTRLVSKTASGTLADGSSFDAVTSASGRYIAFTSVADNLGGDSNFDNVFRKDMETGAIRLVSRTRGGDPGNSHSYDPSISANGRYVAFTTEADNLPGDDLEENVVVKDMGSGRVILAARTTGGDPANDFSSDASISSNARFVAFESGADNLGGDPLETNVFVHDLETRRTRLVSKTSGGDPASGGDSTDPSISGTGRFIAFESNATNLSGEAASTDDQTYVRDMRTGKTRLVSKTTGGDPANGDSEDPSISVGGRYVAFESAEGTNLPGAAPAGDDQAYVHDRETRRTRLISKTSGGTAANGDSEDPSLSGGRDVTFESEDSTNLPGATAWDQVYRHDRETGRTILVSKNNAGDPADDVANLVRGTRPISANGSYIVFDSQADNLGAGATLFEHVYRRGPLP